MLTTLRRIYCLGTISAFLGVLLLGGANLAHASAAAPTTAPSAVAAEPISLLWSIPFVLLLACIALMPFIHKHWWEKYYPLVAVALGAISAYYYFAVAPSSTRWIEEMESYVSFIVLLGSLFVVSGGIVIHVNRKATPLANCVLLALGAVIANIFGTTGASILLIRPYLRMNKGHIKPFHVVFFIFAVSNAGGLLTPIGDPPLFLGYLSGVPFWWVLQQCQWLWLVVVGILLVIFFILDTLDHGRNGGRHSPNDPGRAVTIQGIHNLLFIALVVWAVFQPGFFDLTRLMHDKGAKPELLARLLISREVLMLAAAVGSTLLTARPIYRENEFNYAPIKEVAILFIGIFSTMVPALQWLNVNASRLPIQTPGHFYFASGALSSVLDNAPTYLTFLEAQLGKLDPAKVDQAVAELNRLGGNGAIPDIDKTLDESVQRAVLTAVQYHPNEVRNRELTRQQIEISFLLGDPRLSLYLIAVSAGAVLFGACTYIGNGPNFMVKSIADAWGVQTPSFIGYILRYTLPVLLPTYILIWLLFLSH